MCQFSILISKWYIRRSISTTEFHFSTRWRLDAKIKKKKLKIFQLLVSGGQPTTATSPAMSSGGALSPGALSPSSTATTTGAAAAAASGGASTPVAGATGPGCCENGRPMMTDPVTGQSVCSCQYDSAARLALGAYPRLAPTATSYSSYPTPTPSTTDQGPYPSIGMDSSAFYPPLVSSSP